MKVLVIIRVRYVSYVCIYILLDLANFVELKLLISFAAVFSCLN